MDDKLYKFSRVAEVGSFTKASKELHISQPALTIAIQKLERELGAPLLTRSGKRLELTMAGDIAYRTALEQLDSSQHLKRSIDQLSKKRVNVTIGCIDSIAERLYTTAMFSELEYAADVTLVVNNSRYLREHIERRRMDAAITIYDGLEHAGIDTKFIGNEQLYLVCGSDIASQTLNDFKCGKLPNFISYDTPSTTFRHIKAIFEAESIAVKSKLFSTSPTIMLGMVLQGRGCAVLPATTVEKHIAAGEITVIPIEITRPIAVVTATNRILPDYVTQFLSEAGSLLDQ